MMKYILKLLILVTAVLWISGCGTTSSNGKISVNVTQNKLNTSQNKMNINFVIKNSYSENITVRLKNLSLSLTPCEIDSVVFSRTDITFYRENSQEEIEALVTFVGDCTPSTYQLKGTTSLTLDGETKEIVLDSFVNRLTETETETEIEIETETEIEIEIDTVTETETETPVIVEDVTLPIVVIPSNLKTIELISNSKEIEIPIKVFKDVAPYVGGSIKVELPLKVLNGVDVGFFESYEVDVNSQGIALFKYTGPSNLKVLLDSNDTNSMFTFYHTENSTSKQALTVTYGIEADTYIPIDYVLNITTQDNDFSMGIPEIQKTFSVVLKNSKDEIIDNNDINITKIEVETENALIAQLLNTDTQTTTNQIILNNENSSVFILVSKKLSGIAPIRVNIEFKDINEEAQVLSTVVNVRIMSGPPSAISISYVGTGHDSIRGKYEENFAVSVTDEYGNKVSTKPYISVGAIVGYAVDGKETSSVETNDTKRLFYGINDIEDGVANGEIVNLGDEVNSTNFEDNTATRSNVFQWVNAEGENTDKLVVFGKGKNYEAMGKWDFKKLTNNTLSLEDDYFGIDRSDLSYAVGHNYYQDQCQEDGREWLGSTDSDTYQLDDEGTVSISYKYDYQLMGKDALIWVNLNGYQSDTGKDTRIGEVTKHTLRGQGVTKIPSSGYSLDQNTTASVTFEIWHEAVNKRYRNANFAWAVTSGSSCTVLATQSSNDHDARTCNNGWSSEGSSYVTFTLSSPVNSSCSFDLERLLISDEF